MNLIACPAKTWQNRHRRTVNDWSGARLWLEFRETEVVPVIRIDPHTAARAVERGASEPEIRDVLAEGVVIPARGTRMAKARVFPYNAIWNGRFYSEKRVEVIYLTQGDDLVTVTVYVFFGSWR
jgi:hypothetical protein